MKRVLQYAMLSAALLFRAGAEEPAITKQQADAILEELKQIRQILEKQAKLAQEAARQPQEPQVQKAKLKLDNVQMLGKADAPLTIVEFTDYQCPFCQRFHSTTFTELKKNFVDTGKVRFISRDLPLDFHANAFRAAEAARCAGDQGQFWRMRDVLGSNPSKLGAEDIEKYAQEVQLNLPTFRACMDLGKYKTAIQEDLKVAQSIGVNGTPSFVIGKTTPEGVDGELMVGALPYGLFEEKLSKLAQ
jgi:protein-disulfide isomerase